LTRLEEALKEFGCIFPCIQQEIIPAHFHIDMQQASFGAQWWN